MKKKVCGEIGMFFSKKKIFLFRQVKKREFGVCVRPIFVSQGRDPQFSFRLVEWLELLKAMGVEEVILYVHHVGGEETKRVIISGNDFVAFLAVVSQVLEYYRKNSFLKTIRLTYGGTKIPDLPPLHRL